MYWKNYAAKVYNSDTENKTKMIWTYYHQAAWKVFDYNWDTSSWTTTEVSFDPTPST
jgi:hypothetical protein